MSSLVPRRLWCCETKWNWIFVVLHVNFNDILSILLATSWITRGGWKAKRYIRLISLVCSVITWELFVQSTFNFFFVYFHSFYSSPYSISTNRMIAQTSITPFIAASPVSTYQVSGASLKFAGFNWMMKDCKTAEIDRYILKNAMENWLSGSIVCYLHLNLMSCGFVRQSYLYNRGSAQWIRTIECWKVFQEPRRSEYSILEQAWWRLLHDREYNPRWLYCWFWLLASWGWVSKRQFWMTNWGGSKCQTAVHQET